ncbi:L,D-transpeptidase [Actinophytocola sp.]|uniref:L,D-transpeptidase n=1 Tax=Actinophytocola sp. TaxID=1872138 RepID=UPI002D7E5CCA|nr:Ig-like domain-containing protein [Actinophytocola sp.]HET9143586.1 Ig-like domain-containing protein [Actinophytocola sp.]
MRASRTTVGLSRRRTALRTVAALVLAGALAATAGCSGGGGDAGGPRGAGWKGGAGGGADNQNTQTEPELGATVTDPAPDATDVAPLTRIAFTTREASGVASLTLTDSKGGSVPGELAADGKSWVPAEALKWGTKYTAAITVDGADGKTATTTSSFTVMAKPEKLVRVSTQLGDDAVVGIGMPLIVNFGRSIPKSLRDDVQKRMTVTSTPAQTGAWNWLSGTEVQYRPKAFWKANTKISVKVAARGLPMGSGWYGRSDITLRVKVGSAVVMTVSNNSKRMTVKRNGKVLRTIPISLGKPSTPSSSGTMVVMGKLRKTVFDTFDELGPKEGYRVDIEYAQRLTYGGEFLHAAPWSVDAQGRRNVSHGCVNMSMANAAWLFGVTKMGDPVTIKGTERKLANGNGWTAWNVSWKQWTKGSALPVEG